MRFSVIAQSIFVCALGLWLAALAHLFAQYVLFSGQMLRLPMTGVNFVSAAIAKPHWLWWQPERPDAVGMTSIAAFGCALQLGWLVLALQMYRRSAEPSARVSVLSGAAIIGSLACLALTVSPVVYGVECSYGFVRRSASDSVGIDFSQRAAQFANGVSYLFYALGYGVLTLVPQLLLLLATCATSALTLAGAAGLATARELEASDAQLASVWARVPAPPAAAVIRVCALLCVLGGLPLAVGALMHSVLLTQALHDIAHMASGDKTTHLLAEVDGARTCVGVGFWLCMLGCTVTLLVAVWSLVVRPARARHALAPGAHAYGHAWLALSASLLVAMLCGVSLRCSLPYYTENRQPLAVDPRGVVGVPADSEGPAIEGPDKLELAPFLNVSPGRAMLDGRVIRTDALSDDLSALKRSWRKAHPERTFIGKLAVLCGAGTTGREVVPLLTAAADVTYTQLQFVFGRFQLSVRPVLGTIRVPHFSAARAALLSPGAEPWAPSSAVVEFRFDKRCDEVNSELAALRRAGRTVELRLPPQ
jgi:hypothetical protein